MQVEIKLSKSEAEKLFSEMIGPKLLASAFCVVEVDWNSYSRTVTITGTDAPVGSIEEDEAA